MEWALEAERGTYEAIFSSLNPTDGKLSGKACKPTLVASKLPRGVLKQVWRLADVDNDGYVRAIAVQPTGGVCLPCGVVGSHTGTPRDLDRYLELEEFCVAMHLITVAQGGGELPDELPADLMPPSKR